MGLGVDVIAAYSGPPTRAARGASTSIPIVANLVADPVALGFAATLAQVMSRREFVVNLKIAGELGVSIPDVVMKRADRIIRSRRWPEWMMATVTSSMRQPGYLRDPDVTL